MSCDAVVSPLVGYKLLHMAVILCTHMSPTTTIAMATVDVGQQQQLANN